MNEEFRTPRRPPRDTETGRVSGRLPETPGELDEAESTEPDGGGTGQPGFWTSYLPSDPPGAESGEMPEPGRPRGSRYNGAGGLGLRQEESAWNDQAERPEGHPTGYDGWLPAVPSAGSPAGDVPAGVVPHSPGPAAPPGLVKIGLWGSPASGKTTYLAALPQALSNTDGSVGRWTIFPNSDASTELLIRWSHQLISEQVFPEATGLGDVTGLAWRFVGDLTGSRYMRRSRFRRRPPAESEFDLDLIDVSGEAFGYNPAGKNVSPSTVDTALNHLASAEGLIFLFDPVTERDRKIAAEYVNRTLTMLSRKVVAEGRLIGPYLPHYVAVCITKFDHKDVFRQAREAGLVNYGPDGMPRVLDAQAADLFDVICEGRFWADQRTDSHGGALFVRNQLRRYFHPDRIRYYAVSSIGYKKPPGWDPQATRPGFQFDPGNFSNLIEQGGEQKILGPVEPVNVLEPLIDLHMQITGRG
jgi:hypothetical protein